MSDCNSIYTPPSPQLLERMPALDEAEHARDRLGGAEVKASGAVAAEGQGPLLSAVVLEGEWGGGLRRALSSASSCGSGPPIRPQRQLTSSLPSAAPLGTPAAPAAQGGGLDDLLGPSSEPAAAADLMDLLSASPTKPTAPAAAAAADAIPAAASVSFPSVTAYQHAASGVSVTFSFSKVGLEHISGWGGYIRAEV